MTVTGQTRRAVLAGTGAAGVVVVLGGCQAYGDTGAASSGDGGAGGGNAGDGDNAAGGNAGAGNAGAGGDASAGTGNTGDGGGGAPAGGPALAKAADIPVGGGKIFKAENVVVTQPAKGTFKCFSAECTHAGCQVAEVAKGTINCPCHGSKFKIADGSVANGPAAKPLPARKITVNGDSITLA